MTKPTLTHVLSVAALVVGLLALARNGATPAQANMLTGAVSPQAALGTGFTYQGYLTRGGTPINGRDQCDMRFGLWDAASAGAQAGNTETINGVDFTNGTFTVTLNEAGQFGARAFDGQARWLQVDLACPSGSASFSTIGRQAITAVPYALHSMSTGGLQGRAVSAAAPSAGQALKWDGSAWSPADAYARTVVVSPADTPAASGARLLAALQAINATADKPYLLKIEPGVYDLGANTLQMKPYVDIEGSGQGVTRLVGTGTPGSAGVVNGANNAELRQISITVTSAPGQVGVGILNSNVSPHISDTTVSAEAAGSIYGIRNMIGAAPRLERVTVRVSAAPFAVAVINEAGSTPTLVDVSLHVQAVAGGTAYGLQAAGDPDGSAPPIVVVDGAVIEATSVTGSNNTAAVYSANRATVHLYNVRAVSDHLAALLQNRATMTAAETQLDGAVAPYLGINVNTLVCANVYTGDFTPLDRNCFPKQ